FGDSLADTGNLAISGTPAQLSAIKELPYGETYFNKPTGRCSDGRLVIDFIAKAFGLPFLPPYLNKFADYSSGVNFAVAGATALNASFFEKRQIPIFTNSSLNTQTQWFKDFKKKYCSGREDCEEHFEKSLFVLGEIGGNDFNYPFGLGISIEKVKTFVPAVIQAIRTALETLIQENGKKFLVPGNLPIGCSPSYLVQPSNSSSDFDDLGCLVKFNEFSQYGNHLLRIMLQDVQRDHPDVSIVYADNYSATMRILRNPQKFGLQKNVLRVCCGFGGKYNYSPPLSCNVNATLCPNPEQYLNWDGVHLTDTGYRAIAHMLINGEFTKPSLKLFGDSLANTGNIASSGTPAQLSAIKELPYGKTYFNKATGCCADGRRVIDFIEIGGNGLNYTFGLGISIEKVKTFVSLVIQAIRTSLETLIQENGKKFQVPGNLPIGCSPSYLVPHPSNSSSDFDDLGCLVKFNKFSQYGNHLLRIMLQDVQRDHPEVSI
ncbi:hypothetical protein KI387_029335, partial [Taxus chinensis]